MKFLEQQFSIENKDDWYNITKRQVILLGGESLLSYYGGLRYFNIFYIFINLTIIIFIYFYFIN